MQFSWEKENNAGPKQVALENNVNFSWSKMKFLGSKKIPYETNEVPWKRNFHEE
jgi:hypothetical protein